MAKMNTKNPLAPALKKGDSIRVIAPSSYTPYEDRLQKSIVLLESWGLKVELQEGWDARHLHMAGKDEHRANELLKALKDPHSKAIVTVRGGGGASRLIKHLPLESLKKYPPKRVVGYSDFSTLHLCLQKYQPQSSFFYGPCLVSPCLIEDEQSRQSFYHALFDEKISLSLEANNFWKELRMGEDVEDNLLQAQAPTQKKGDVKKSSLATNNPYFSNKAPMTGGCLSVLVTSLGTPWQLKPDQCWLFLEDVGEKAYAIERMLSHLENAGIFKNLAGILLGQFVDCADAQELQAVFKEIFKPYPFAIYEGINCGHGSSSLTLPLGAQVELKSSKLVFS